MTATSEDVARGRRLTGRGVFLWLFAFFGVVFAVNGAFVYFAESTFPGLEVESSYKAGQEFEGEVQAGKAQAERGWTVDAAVRPVGDDASVEIHFRDKAGADLHGLDVRASLIHAVDPNNDHSASLPEVASGTYRTVLPKVQAGMWELTIEAYKGNERMFLSHNQLRLVR
ncbi:FixH family protein [Pleomorphomonas sp. PLEO]|uniref:FixH family protein n=1 Tax=Pleomorphomonas sp. PLEO TaxID=3239306 RepID=UPI00351E62E0